MTFTPQTLPNSSGTLVVHWAARLDTGYSDTDPVGTMNAQSGTSFDATQGTAAAKPTYKTSIINGQPVFRFDGGDFLTSGALADWKFLHDSTDWTALVVFATSTSNPDTFYYLLDTSGGAASANIGATMFYDDRSSVSREEQLHLLIAKGSSGNTIIDVGYVDDAVISASFSIVELRYEFGGAGNDGTAYVDGLLVSGAETANTPHSAANPTNTLAIGAYGTTPAMVGDIAEILIYTGALDDTDRVYVEDNLREIYYETVVPNSYTPIDEAGDYDGLGFHAITNNNEIQYYGRRGTKHDVETVGKLRQWTSDDGGATFSQADIADHASYDDRGPAGGLVPATGTIMCFLGRYNVGGAASQDIRYHRSTDNGANWTDVGAIDVGSDTSFLPYGPLVELPSGKLMQTFYGEVGGTWRLFVQYSTDDGLTWGSGVNIVSSATAYTEPACCFVSGATDGAANLLLVTRNNVGVLRQFKSDDGGATWSNQGNLTFSSGAGKDVSPWLFDDGTYIHLLYGDRTAWKLAHAWGVGADLLTSETNWINPQYIHIFGSTTAGDQGYPSMTMSDAGEFYIMFHDDSTDTPNEADIYRSANITFLPFMTTMGGIMGPVR